MFDKCCPIRANVVQLGQLSNGTKNGPVKLPNLREKIAQTVANYRENVAKNYLKSRPIVENSANPVTLIVAIDFHPPISFESRSSK